MEAVSRAQTNGEKLNKVLEFVKNIDVAEWEKICPRTVIKWDNDNCIFATELQKRICTSPRFVTFFSLLNDIEFPCDTYPLVGELVKFVCECIKKPGFDNNGAISCMSILETLAKDKRMPWGQVVDDEKITPEYVTSGKKSTYFWKSYFIKFVIQDIREWVGDDKVFGLEVLKDGSERRVKGGIRDILCGIFDGERNVLLGIHLGKEFKHKTEEEVANDESFKSIVRDIASGGNNRVVRGDNGIGGFEVQYVYCYCIEEDYHAFCMVYYPSEGAWYSYDNLRTAKKLKHEEVCVLVGKMLRSCGGCISQCALGAFR